MTNNIEVEVIYSDLSKKKVLLDKIDELQKDNVLFIAVLSPDPKREGKVKRITAKNSFDHYALCLRTWDAAEWVLLHGWNDDDFVWRNTTKPYEVSGSIKEGVPPFGCFHVVFNGILVSPEKWKEAENIFNQQIK